MSSPIKIIHTSDWHLGKKLYRLERIDEQIVFLDWLIKYITENDIDALIIAGDIFDTPNPPHEALKLFYKFIAKLESLNVHSIIISGNHDSSTLINAISPLVNSDFTHIFTQYQNVEKMCLKLQIREKSIGIMTQPFFRLHNLEQSISLTEAKELNAQQILNAYINQGKNYLNNCDYKIFCGHHLYGSFMTAGSEQTIVLSEIESIPLSMLEGFDYLALGHIHKPQKIKNEKPCAYYSGSPIPMRFSEKEEKIICLVEITDTMKIKEIKLPKFRELVSLDINGDDFNTNQIDSKLSVLTSPLAPAIEVVIFMKAPKIGIIDKIDQYIRKTYSNIEVLSIRTEIETTQNEINKEINHIADIFSLFELYYLQKYPNETNLPKDIMKDFRDIYQQAIEHHENQ